MGRKYENSPNGRYVRAASGSTSCRAFIPNPLPPEITWDIGMVSAVSASDRAIGQLSSIGRLLPNPHLLSAPFMRKEAVQSSRIEGTQASVDDLYLFEASALKEQPGSDVREVYNYDLPYTDEYESLYTEFIARTGLTMTRHDVWRALASQRKAKKLVRKER